MNLNKLKKAELIEQVQQLQKKILFLEDEMQEIRIKQKYAEFDAEATGRENAYLRKLLADRDKN